MLVKKRIHGETYRKLIQYAHSRCDAVMFTTQEYMMSFWYGQDSIEYNSMKKTTEVFERQLKQDFLKKRTDSRWAHVEKIDPKTNSRHKEGFGVYVYNFSVNTLDYLLANDDFYKWRNPEYPEDVSFFKDGYCWLSSIAHEQMCFIFCKDAEEFKFLRAIGIEFYSDKFESTPKNSIFYESY